MKRDGVNTHRKIKWLINSVGFILWFKKIGLDGFERQNIHSFVFFSVRDQTL